MNGILKPTYKIQQNPKGEWMLTKGAVRFAFDSEEAAIAAMKLWINTKVNNYDAEGKEM